MHDGGTNAGIGGTDSIIFGSAIDPATLSIVNGNTIVAGFATRTLILAEALPVESYLDAGDRSNFGECCETIRLFPDFAAHLMSDAALVWETKGTAPLVMAGHALDRARRTVEAPCRRWAS